MKDLEKHFTRWVIIFDIENKKEKYRQLQVEVSQDGFWDSNDNTEKTFNKLNQLKADLNEFEELLSKVDDLDVILQCYNEDPDDEILEEANDLNDELNKLINTLEFKSLLNSEYDASNCYFSLKAGAGGTDAQDWTMMLLRMYTRWFDKRKYNYEILDQTFGEEAGLKSVTLHVKGDFAYGFIKGEIGVHRLVRQSPFNANSKRQTSFAAVELIPEITESYDNVVIDPVDLKIDTFRASGAGGQHVNKTDSAVRVTHIPTGLIAQSQSSRSQTSNKEVALNILKSRIVKLMKDEHKQKISDIKGANIEIAWGNQIRSYVFHPYKLVKDLRTNVESSNINAVMDGDLDNFVNAFLRLKEK